MQGGSQVMIDGRSMVREGDARAVTFELGRREREGEGMDGWMDGARRRRKVLSAGASEAFEGGDSSG